jgi:hypothetical protein
MNAVKAVSYAEYELNFITHKMWLLSCGWLETMITLSLQLRSFLR